MITATATAFPPPHGLRRLPWPLVMICCLLAAASANAQTEGDNKNLLSYPLEAREDQINPVDASSDKTLDAMLAPILALPSKAKGRPGTSAPNIVLEPLTASTKQLKFKWKADKPVDVTKPMKAAEYLKLLQTIHPLGYAFCSSTGVLTVSLRDEEGEAPFRHVDEKELEGLENELKKLGWESTATYQKIRHADAQGNAAFTDAHDLVLRGPKVLLQEVRRKQDPNTLDVQLRETLDGKPLSSVRYPLPYALSGISTPVRVAATGRVSLKEAVKPLEQGLKIKIDMSDEVAAREVDFSAMPPEWLEGEMPAGRYLGLLQSAGVSPAFRGGDGATLTLSVTGSPAKVVFKVKEAAQAYLLYQLRAAGWEGEVFATSSPEALTLSGPPVLINAARVWADKLEKPTSNKDRLPLDYPLQDFEKQKVQVPALAMQSGEMTVADALAPLLLDTGRTKADKTAIKLTTMLSDRVKNAKVRFNDQPAGYIQPSMSVPAYQRLLQECGLILACKNAGETGALCVSGKAEAASPIAVITFDKLDAAGYTYVISKLRTDGWSADVEPKAVDPETKADMTLPPEKEARVTFTGQPEIITAIKALQETGKPVLSVPTDAITGVGSFTNDEVGTWEYPLSFGQAKSLRVADNQVSFDIPGVVELLNNIVASSTSTSAGIPSISVHPRRNAVVIMDYVSRRSFYDGLIKQLDQERPMIELSIAVVDIGSDNGQSWGTELLAGSNQGSGTERADMRLGSFAGTDLNPVLDVINSTGSHQTNLGQAFHSGLLQGRGFSLAGLISSSSTQLLARVSALEGEGKAHLLSRPSIMTLSGLEASFSDSSKIYVSLPAINLANVFEIPVTTKIKIMPRVAVAAEGGMKTVQMVVMLTDSAVVDTAGAVNGVQTPVVTSSTLITHAEVGNEGSVVVGGRYRHTQLSVKAAAPLLGKIPVLGLPFKKRTLSDDRTQRFFVISPRIVKVGSTAASAVLPPQERLYLPPHLATSHPGYQPPVSLPVAPAEVPKAQAVDGSAPKKKGMLDRFFKR